MLQTLSTKEVQSTAIRIRSIKGSVNYPITANQVAMCMAMVKISRSVESPQYQDNYADALGYIAISKTCHDALTDEGLDWVD
jgi:hypothetical protein